jgi:hypothetical protein
MQCLGYVVMILYNCILSLWRCRMDDKDLTRFECFLGKMFPRWICRIAEQQTQNNGTVPIASSCCNRRCARSQLGFESSTTLFSAPQSANAAALCFSGHTVTNFLKIVYFTLLQYTVVRAISWHRISAGYSMKTHVTFTADLVPWA